MRVQILAEDYRPVLEAVKGRLTRVTDLKVVDGTPAKGKDPTIGVEGLILAFVARRGSGVLDLVKKAATDLASATDLIGMVRRQSKKFKPVSLKQGIGLMLKEDVFAELRYGGETLVQTLFVPKGADFIFEEFPYNGGALAIEGFQLVERVRDGSDAALESIIVKINPTLSADEKAALKLVPSSQLGRNVGAACCCGDSYTAIGVVVAAVVATALLTCLRPVPLAETITKEELAKLGPAASARKLLEVRRAAIMKNWPAG
jgi:hypothetical protein